MTSYRDAETGKFTTATDAALRPAKKMAYNAARPFKHGKAY